jgi:transposase
MKGCTMTDHLESTSGSLHGSLHARLAWMICYRETGNAKEVCRRFGISRKTFYKWLKRYKKADGDSASLLDQSRRPHRFPRATPESSVALLKHLKEETGFGQRKLKAYLREKHNILLSERTIWKILKRIEQGEGQKSIQPQKGSCDKVRFSESM